MEDNLAAVPCKSESWYSYDVKILPFMCIDLYISQKDFIHA